MNKKLLALCMGGIIMGACTNRKAKEALEASDNRSELYLFVGSYADPQEEGIKVYRFNEETAEAVYVSGVKGLSNPSYLVPSVDGERVYAVGEGDDSGSTANSLLFNKEEGKLTLLNSQPAQGGAPCYITLNPSGNFVVTANYAGGSITVFALDKEGKLAADPRLISFIGDGPDKERQAQPHLHCVAFTPDHNYLLAVDLGSDKIHVFPVSKDVSAGVSHSLLSEGDVSEVELESGSGPRHICFHPNGKFAYLINELSGKVTTFSYGGGKLRAIQYIEADTVGARGSGDIHISPDGRFVYASNRLKADGIAVFSVNEETGMLAKAGYQSTGIHPRNFIITPNGRYLLVACRDNNQIQIFGIDKETGLLTDTGRKIETHRPVCLKFTGR